MKRKRENGKIQKPPKKRKKKVKDCFNDIEKQINEQEDLLVEYEKKIITFKNTLKYSENVYLEQLDININSLNEIIHNKIIIGYHEAFFSRYVSNFKSVLRRIKIKIKDYKIKKKKVNKNITKLTKKLDKVKKIYKYKECGICRNHFKGFGRNCSCKSDQYMCLVCIKKLYTTAINDVHLSGRDTICGHIPCPYCKQEMKNFSCPFCKKEHNAKCNWCIQNKEIENLRDNFIKIYIKID